MSPHPHERTFRAPKGPPGFNTTGNHRQFRAAAGRAQVATLEVRP